MTINNNILNQLNQDLSSYKNTKLMIVTKNQSIEDIETQYSKMFFNYTSLFPNYDKPNSFGFVKIELGLEEYYPNQFRTRLR